MEPAENLLPITKKSYLNNSEVHAIAVHLSNLVATYDIKTVAQVLDYMAKTGRRYVKAESK